MVNENVKSKVNIIGWVIEIEFLIIIILNGKILIK